MEQYGDMILPEGAAEAAARSGQEEVLKLFKGRPGLEQNWEKWLSIAQFYRSRSWRRKSDSEIYSVRD